MSLPIAMKLKLERETWPYKVPFGIARGAEVALNIIVVTLTGSDGIVGRGEAAGVDYDGETVALMSQQMEAFRADVEVGIDFNSLATRLPPGGARNALDCALWDMTARRREVSVWEMANITDPKPLTTSFTLGIDTDEATRAGATQYRDWPLLKVKVNHERHIEVIRLVRKAAPNVRILIDPNQSWTVELLNTLAPELHALGVVLIEQPVARGQDSTLSKYTGKIRLAADESVIDRRSLPAIRDYYQVVNIKLDKTGGLTEALALAREVRHLGMAVMVGCMAGTSLAMAPGMVVGQLAEFIDLDGPLLHGKDRIPGIEYHLGRMQLPPAALWGGAGS